MLSVRKSRYGCTREVWRAKDISYWIFFARIYGPSTKHAGAINRVEKTRLVFKVGTYIIEVSASCIEKIREMDEIRTEWLMTLPRIPEFLAALEIKFPNGSFLKDPLCTKHHHLVFSGVYCNEKWFIARTVTIL